MSAINQRWGLHKVIKTVTWASVLIRTGNKDCSLFTVTSESCPALASKWIRCWMLHTSPSLTMSWSPVVLWGFWMWSLLMWLCNCCVWAATEAALCTHCVGPKATVQVRTQLLMVLHGFSRLMAWRTLKVKSSLLPGRTGAQPPCVLAHHFMSALKSPAGFQLIRMS